MKQTELKGIITPILTPMNADESKIGRAHV